jgi:hypothetical protein
VGGPFLQVPEKMRCTSNPSDKERVETEIIKTLIGSYFDIVKVREKFFKVFFPLLFDLIIDNSLNIILFLLFRKISLTLFPRLLCVFWF